MQNQGWEPECLVARSRHRIFRGSEQFEPETWILGTFHSAPALSVSATNSTGIIHFGTAGTYSVVSVERSTSQSYFFTALGMVTSQHLSGAASAISLGRFSSIWITVFKVGHATAPETFLPLTKMVGVCWISSARPA